MATIRPAQVSDRDAIVAFNTRLAAETEDKKLDGKLITRGVGQLLADPAKGRYWIAEEEGAPVGQIMVTYEWSDWRCGWFWWIQSVYVEEGYRGRGIYRALFDQVKAEARASEDVCGLRLYVDKDNRQAMRVYDHTGIKPAGYEMRELDFRGPASAKSTG